MKKYIIAVAVICLFCSSAYAADYCDTKYMELINRLKKSDKILDDQKAEYLPSLKKALELCKQNNMEEARNILDELKDQVFQDALTHKREYSGN
jgi:polyhydroxyalkanoate synthesis regulator phasin